MSDPNADGSSRPDRGESPPKLAFVTARPGTLQGRREAKAVIRAHASQASWAKIKKKGRQQRETIARIGLPGLTRPEHRRRSSSAGEPASTELVSYSNDRLHNDDSSEAAPASFKQVVPSRAFMQTMPDSISVPVLFRTVGAGDVDPFASYPSSLPKEVATPIMVQVTNFFNVVFMPEPGRPDQSFVEHWKSWYMSDSTLFHASCFAQLSRQSATETGLKPIDRKVLWYCYSEVVRDINKGFNDPSQRCSDKSIHAVQTLAFHGDTTAVDADTSRSPTQGPLNRMQGLDLYAGRLSPVNMHVDGLARMLSMRGGISQLEFPGLAAVLSYGDVILASGTLQPPVYPFVPLGEPPARILSAVSRKHHPLAQLGSGFQILHQLLPEKPAKRLIFALRSLSDYSLAVEDYIMGRPQASILRTLADQRNFVQHSLLSIRPTLNENRDGSPEDVFLLYEACWTAGVIYSFITVFPIPHPKAPFAKLAQELKEYLVNTSAHFARSWQKPSQLVLWMTFLGALASTADGESAKEKAWYINVLERLVHRMQILSWEELKDVLLNFLWFPSTSDINGQQLWEEVQTSNPFT